MTEISETDSKWHHPIEVMKLQKLKKKKKALQARIRNEIELPAVESKFENIFSSRKRQNPFLKTNCEKKSKIEQNDTTPILEESTDQTLFNLLNPTSKISNCERTTFQNSIGINNKPLEVVEVELVQAQGEKWIPIDWSLKNKMRLISLQPFPWNQKLKISEEASGVTAFTRCLDSSTETTLDISPNAKFYQCCLYWQQPSLPWLTLFPRNNSNKSELSFKSVLPNVGLKESLQKAWSDSLRSLFQLIRTGQCPYFYVCANTFTVLFRAAGICGLGEIHAVITPTTRGFRKLLKQEDIEYTMPLKKSESDQGSALDSLAEDNEDLPDKNWLKSLGVNDDDIKQISYTQDSIEHKKECHDDNSEQSTVLVEGVEVQAFYNFLINCKSITSLTGQFAEIPPTLLAPVAFYGASLNSLKIRETKVHADDENYYSLELSGPILPHMVHNLFEITPPENNMTITFNTTKLTEPFNKLKSKDRKSDLVNQGAVVFRKENLSDCGLLPKVLKHFCVPENNDVTTVECIKYTCENKTYSWT